MNKYINGLTYCRKWNQQTEYKCWMSLLAYNIVLMPLGKV